MPSFSGGSSISRSANALTQWVVATVLAASAICGVALVGDRPMLAAIYLLVCGGLLLFILFRPQPLTLLYFLIFITPLGVLTQIPGTETTIRPFVGLAVTGFWGLAALLERARLILTRELGYMALFMAAAVVTSLLQGGGVRESLRPLMTYVQIFVLVFLVLQNITTVQRLNLVFWIIAVALGVVAFLMCLEGLGLGPNIGVSQVKYSSGAYARASSVYDTAGSSGYVMMVCLVIGVILLRMAKNVLSQTVIALILVLAAAGLFLTLTLSGILAAAVALPMTILRDIRISFRKIVVYTGGLLLALSILYIAFPPFAERISDHYYRMITEKNIRTHTWRGATEVFLNNPVLGVGAGQTEQLIGDYFPIKHHLFGKSRVAHNTFLAIAGDHGLVGLIPFVLLLGAVLRGLYRGASRALAAGEQNLALLCHGVFTVLVASMLPMCFLDLQREDFLWLFIALGLSLIHMCSELETPPAGAASQSRPVLAG